MFTIGGPHDEPLYDGLDLHRVPDVRDGQLIVVTGLDPAFGEEPEDYRDLLSGAASRGAVMLCANPDVRVPVGDRLIWCAGALAELYRALRGEVIEPGKPHAPISALARRKIDDGARILCVGDGPSTDIAGALREGLDCVFISGGLMRHQQSGADGKSVADYLSRHELRATWFTPSFFW